MKNIPQGSGQLQNLESTIQQNILQILSGMDSMISHLLFQSEHIGLLERFVRRNCAGILGNEANQKLLVLLINIILNKNDMSTIHQFLDYLPNLKSDIMNIESLMNFLLNPNQDIAELEKVLNLFIKPQYLHAFKAIYYAQTLLHNKL